LKEHYLDKDPGLSWIKDKHIAIDSDSVLDDENVLSPNVVELQNGALRMYYMGFGSGRPNKESEGYILSAISKDGVNWEKESGIRLDIDARYNFNRVLSPEVIHLEDGKYRMFFEARISGEPSVVASAISREGLIWRYEHGFRISNPNCSLGTPRCLYFYDDTIDDYVYRLYFHSSPYPFYSGLSADNNILSAVSTNGFDFIIEEGVRVGQDSLDRESRIVYAADVIMLSKGDFRMYYSGWSDNISGGVFSAYSTDGLNWVKEKKPILDLDRQLDINMVSEPCVISMSNGRVRMYYEAEDNGGKRHILSALSV